MKWSLVALLLLATTARAEFRLPKNRDLYFIEDNLVYRRCLELMRDGAYRQIDKDRTSCREVDEGRWEQLPDGTVRLHALHHALRFRALLAGPLTVVLDSQAKLDALPALAAAARRFLTPTQDTIFAARTVEEYAGPPLTVAIDPHAETYRRDELFALLRQIDDAVSAERGGFYTFTPFKTPGAPLLLILQDAVFQADQLAKVRQECFVKPGAAPPFYFAQVDARTFVRDVGAWTVFRFPGGPD